MTDFGQHLASYYANPFKLLFNTILGIFLLASGIFISLLAVDMSLFWIPAALLILIGLWLLWQVLQKLLHAIKIYEGGLSFGGKQIRFSDIIGIQDRVDNGIVMTEAIFTTNDAPIHVTSYYWQWEKAVKAIKDGAIASYVQAYQAKLEREDMLEFNALQKDTALGAATAPLKLVKEGIFLADMSLIGWILIQSIRLRHSNQGRVSAEIVLTNDTAISFILHNSLEAHVLLELIRQRSGK